MRLGVVGTGSMGKNHVRVYSELKAVEDTYVFDMDKGNANRMREYGAKVCGSIGDLMNGVDAVSICVPTRYHLDVAKKAVEKGVHCLIEKPITLSVGEGEELLKVVKDKDLTVGVGHIERFNPIVDEIKKIITNPYYIEIRRHNPGSARITDSTIVEDLMIHDIDIVFNVLFEEDEYRIYSTGNDDLCKVVLDFGGSVVAMSASRLASKKIRSIYVEDKDFTIEGDFMAQEIYVYRMPEKYSVENERYTQENIIEKVLVNKVEPLKVELKEFVDCVIKGKEFPVTPEQALENLRICEAIKKCM
jgi:Predicted dehydrogenases and related proteins